MKEEWKNITGYSGNYLISSFGRVRSVGRFRKSKGGYQCKVYDKILKSAICNGYKIIGLSFQGKVKTRFIHRLVAKEFIPNKDNLPEVNHKNGIKHDNYIFNLEWTTHRMNGQHASRIKLLAVGSKHGLSKLKEPQIPTIRREYRYGKSTIEISKQYKVNPETIRSVIIGKTWKHVK